MKKYPLISLSWQKGIIFDRWTFVHFISGLILGGILFLLGANFNFAALLTLALLIGWEIFEKFIGIGEIFSNVLSDLIFGMIGFYLASYWVNVIEINIFIGILVLAFVTNIGLSYFGFRDYLQKAEK